MSTAQEDFGIQSVFLHVLGSHALKIPRQLTKFPRKNGLADFKDICLSSVVSANHREAISFSRDHRSIQFSKPPFSHRYFFDRNPSDLSHPTSETCFAHLLSGLDCDLIHFQGFQSWGTLLLPFVAKALGKKIVLSLEDYFLLCPAHNLQPHTIDRCGVVDERRGRKECADLLRKRWFSIGKPELGFSLDGYLAQRAAIVHKLLGCADTVVGSSNGVLGTYARVFGKDLLKKNGIPKENRARTKSQPPPPQNKSFHVPLALRGLTSIVCRREPLKGLGQAAYAYAAKQAASELLRVRGVQSVYLRGGAVSRCVPGISDLDLTVFLSESEDPNNLVSLIEQFHPIYRKLKRSFWMLGEILLFDPSTWKFFNQIASGLMLVSDPLKKLSGEGPETRSVNCAGLTPAQRFMASFEQYLLAKKELLSPGNGLTKAYHFASFSRNIKKCISHGDPEAIHQNSTDQAEQLARAFLVLDKLARRANTTLPHPEYLIHWNSFEVPCFLEDLARIQRWSDRLNANHSHSKVVPTHLPHIVLFEGECAFLTAFFRNYLNSLRLSNAVPIYHGLPPIVVSPSMFDCYLKGLTMESYVSNTRRIPWEHRNRADWVKQAKSMIYLGLTERITIQTMRASGELIFAPLTYLKRNLTELCVEAMAVTTGHLTGNLPSLCWLAKERLPATSACFHRLNQGPPIERNREFLEAALSATVEIRGVIESTSQHHDPSGTIFPEKR